MAILGKMAYISYRGINGTRWAQGKGSVVGKNIVMSWKDPSPHTPNYVGVMTGWGSTGRWHLCTP